MQVKKQKKVIKMYDEKIFIMVKRTFDQMIVKAYFVPIELPDGIQFSHVVCALNLNPGFYPDFGRSFFLE
jgi:hypothetical protein